MESSRRLELADSDPNGAKGATNDERLGVDDADAYSSSGEEKVVDISGNSWDLSLLERPLLPSSTQELYFYHNTFHLIPRSIKGMGRLKTLKFFANEIEILPREVGDLTQLESLQVKVSLPGLSAISLQKLGSLRDLELCRVPPKLTAFSLLGDISSLKSLTKLSICHFSIRYLPPEIGCLKKLEELDLSFNKLKNLPDDLADLVSLRSLRLANNKLVDLPPGISSLRSLERLDLSNNRLTSLSSLKFNSMDALRYLNLKYNKLPSLCEIPSWIDCNLEGNGEDICKGDACGSSVELGLNDFGGHRVHTCQSCNGSYNMSSALCTEHPSNCRCLITLRRNKGWKRRDDLQQRARQERLNYSRKCRVSDHNDDMSVSMSEESNSCKSYVVDDNNSEIHVDDDEIKLLDSFAKPISSIDKVAMGTESGRCDLIREHSVLPQFTCVDNAEATGFNRSDILNGDDSSFIVNSTSSNKDNDRENEGANTHFLYSSVDDPNSIDKYSSGEASNLTMKSKRQSDKDLDNPKPSKFRKPVEDCSYIANKYCMESFCSIEDHLPDGFYDAGRDRPFMSLQDYEQSVCIDSREIILLDREKDEELDAIALAARLLLSKFRRSNLVPVEEGIFDDLPRVSVLALFVSDCFGGSDRSSSVLKFRKSIIGSDKLQPFICTCSGGSLYDDNKAKGSCSSFRGYAICKNICHLILRSIYGREASAVVGEGAGREGSCWWRKLKDEYQCNETNPLVRSERPRGSLRFSFLNFNAIVLFRGTTYVRVHVGCCLPASIRRPTPPESICRITNLICLGVDLDFLLAIQGCNCASLASSKPWIVRSTSSSPYTLCFGCIVPLCIVRAIIVTTLRYLSNHSPYMLDLIKPIQSVYVKYWGHVDLKKKVPWSEARCFVHEIFMSADILPYISCGSCVNIIALMLKDGSWRMCIDTRLCEAFEVACDASGLHIGVIFGRHIGGKNIFCRLQRSLRMSSSVQIGDVEILVKLKIGASHLDLIMTAGSHLPFVEVGIREWTAMHVLRTSVKRILYGFEVDIWSYGCLLFELLTLQIPYVGKSEAEIYDLLRVKQRPTLPPKLEALAKSKEESASADLGLSLQDTKNMKLLLDLFYQCTEGDSTDRPSAQQLYDALCSSSQQLPADATAPASSQRDS
ncbi:hypothetical protein KSP39_PZI012297 [Platanthera zijinensis]|uniref:Protein kinase domain-containing protein n=1 Tax=Platanthera zijinensis TaxID=2320716 RepID=A0AAP0G4S7_9ASPA